MPKPNESEQPDFGLLAEAIDTARELTQAFVAGLMSDGFTEREARRLVVQFLCAHGEESK